MTITAADQRLRPRSGRTPLKPINSPATPITKTNLKPKPKPKKERTDENQNQHQNQIPSSAADPNEEENDNKPVVTDVESLGTSLADELGVIRKKLERLRSDKERTDKKLNEKETRLDMQMKELQQRGEIQQMLETEVDRLYRLNELKFFYLRVSSIRSLRAKEQGKKINAVAANSHSLELNAAEDEEESVGENILESPCSSFSEIVAEKEK